MAGMTAPQYEKSPFPYNTIEGAGGGFALGMIASCPYYFIKGPMGARLEYIAMNAPRTGGSFAVWSALYETMSIGLAHIRHKEDPWNGILAGGLSSAMFSIRQGFRPAFNQFLIGAALFAGIEGLMLLQQRFAASHPEMQSSLNLNYPQFQIPSPGLEAEKSKLTGWFRRRFGGGKDNNKDNVDNNKTTVLESVDTLPPPMPTFNFS